MSCGCTADTNPVTKYSLLKAGQSIIKHFTDSSYNAFVTEDIKNKRMKICAQCEEIEEFFGKERCKICLCFLGAKASLVDQDCPHPDGSKWKDLE